MAGIIQEQQAAGADVSPAGVRAQMTGQMDAAGLETHAKIVAAGRKILYSEAMAPQIAELLKGPGPTGQKIGQGVMALMALLMDRAGGALPPQAIIPAAVELVAEAGAFLRDAGVKVTEADIAEGMAEMIEGILQKAGVDPAQLGSQMGGEQEAGEVEPPTPEQDAAEDAAEGESEDEEDD